MSTVTRGRFSETLESVVFALVSTGAGLGAGYALTFGAGVVLRAAGVSLPRSLALVLSLVLIQGVGMGGVSIGYLAVRDVPAREFLNVRVPTVRDLIWTVSGFALVIAGYFALSVAVFLLDVQPAQNNVTQFTSGQPELLLLLVPASFLLIGPGEELLFRGVVQGTLREAFGPVPAVAGASLLFGLVHVFAVSGPASGRVVYVAVVSVLAIVLGATYELTDNLVVPALIHGTYNAVLFGLAYVAVRYGPPSVDAAGLVPGAW